MTTTVKTRVELVATVGQEVVDEMENKACAELVRDENEYPYCTVLGPGRAVWESQWQYDDGAALITTVYMRDPETADEGDWQVEYYRVDQ